MGGTILHGTGSLGGNFAIKIGLFALKALLEEERCVSELSESVRKAEIKQRILPES